MKKRLLDWIICPQCGERPRLQVFAEEKVGLPSPVQAPACSAYCARHDVAGSRDDRAAARLQRLLPRGGPGGCPLLRLRVDLPHPRRHPAPDLQRRGGVPGILLAPPPGRRAARFNRTSRAAQSSHDPRSEKSFRLQWATYHEGDNTWFKDDAGLRKQEFLDNFRITAEELKGRTLLDAGCGNGELTRSVSEYGPEIVAMDFSRSVEGARRRLFEKGSQVSHRVHYLQGNVLELPLRPQSFDFVHSSGVLHHTPAPIAPSAR